jgi:hypothetical protein
VLPLLGFQIHRLPYQEMHIFQDRIGETAGFLFFVRFSRLQEALSGCLFHRHHHLPQISLLLYHQKNIIFHLHLLAVI